MSQRTRREFLSDVSQGMLVAAVGFQAAVEMELAPAFAAGGDDADRLRFGKLEPLVELLQQTDPDRLLPLLAERLKTGTELRELVAAAALANARTFGGEDYVGFHTMMALAPSYHMALESPKERQALPVLKVLYRNSRRIQEHGGPESEVLQRIAVDSSGKETADGKALLEAVRQKDVRRAEQIFARISQQSADDAINELLVAVEDNSEVHRIVMPYRAHDLLDIVGIEHAHTLLRQSVRYCVRQESPRYRENCKGGRDVLPKLLDEYRLLRSMDFNSRAEGKSADDVLVVSLADAIFGSTPEQAAEAVAAALADGVSYNVIGEALSLAANQLVLRDAGRPPEQAKAPEKPVGSVHGDSIGVHASDSANAWRNMARIGNQRTRVSCLVLGAYQVAFDRTNRGGNFLDWQPYPTEEQLARIQGKSPQELLTEAEAAIRENNQGRACAAVKRYSELASDARPVFSLLLKYAVTEDGALHAEKYYRTVSEDFAATRPSLRWRHLLGLARVTASAHGRPAPGIREAQQLLES